MRFRNLIALFIVIFSVTLPAQADQLTNDKKADIEQLLKMTGAVAIGEQMASVMVAQMTQSIKSLRPDIPQHLLDALPEEVMAVLKANNETLENAVVLLYHKHFTANEIKEIIKFYSSDSGKKIIQVMPTLVQESMMIGQQWGQSLGPQIEQRVKARFKRGGIEI